MATGQSMPCALQAGSSEPQSQAAPAYWTPAYDWSRALWLQMQTRGIQIDAAPSPWVIIFHPIHMPSEKQVITSDLHIINITPRKGACMHEGGCAEPGLMSYL